MRPSGLPRFAAIKIGGKDVDGFLDGSFLEYSKDEELFLRSQIPAAQAGSCTFLELGELETSRTDVRKVPTEVQAAESDDDLRTRLLYVAGTDRRISIAMGAELDAIAEEYGLRRRQV